MPLLGAFKRHHPGLQISLSLGNSRVLMEDLLARRVDVVVIPDIERDPRLHAVPLRHDRLVAIVPQGHAFGSRREVAEVLHDAEQESDETKPEADAIGATA